MGRDWDHTRKHRYIGGYFFKKHNLSQVSTLLHIDPLSLLFCKGFDFAIYLNSSVYTIYLFYIKAS